MMISDHTSIETGDFLHKWWLCHDDTTQIGHFRFTYPYLAHFYHKY